MRHVDHISEADPDNDKCKLLNFQMPAIEFSGGETHTADALKQAKVDDDDFQMEILSSCFHSFSFSFTLIIPHALEYISESSSAQ